MPQRKLVPILDVPWVSWLVFAGVAFNLAQLALSWHQPILGQYGFRQAQTGISAYWLLKGGPWLTYQTPVLGVPWSIPFEFPFYQWTVAAVVRILPFLTLDQAGRVVSEAFFLGCFWPLRRLTISFELDRTDYYVIAAALLFSPLYVFWSRSFMIESTALFFSVWFVAAVAEYLRNQRLAFWIEMLVTATLAICIKVTTFYGFAIAALCVLLVVAWQERARVITWTGCRKYLTVVLAVVVSFVVFLVWLHYSDGIKAESLLGVHLTGPALRQWNFGTLAQRLSSKLYEVIFIRGPHEALGSWVVVAAVIVCALIVVRKRRLVVPLFLAILYIIPFFTFTNLHIVHHYYQYANSVFLVVAVGYCICLTSKRTRWMAVGLVVLLIASDCFTFYRVYYGDMRHEGRQLQSLLAMYLRRHLPEKEVFVAFGLGYDSEVPYYAERRAVLLPDGMVSAQLLRTFAVDPAKFVGRRLIGMIVVCPNNIATRSSTKLAYKKFIRSMRTNAPPTPVGYCEVYRTTAYRSNARETRSRAMVHHL